MSRVPTIPRMPGPLALPARRALAVALAAAAVGGLAACGTDERTAYADGWDGICGDVGGAASTFRTAVSSASTDSPDPGDAAVAAGPVAGQVTADLRKPAAAYAKALGALRDEAAALDPPDRWAAWHAGELRELDVRLRIVGDGVTRLGRGDADALPLLAVGSIGPSSVRAPADLRDRTPECTALR